MARGRPARATVYAGLENQTALLGTRLGGLPSPKEAEYVWSEIWDLEAHHSTALEGNTLVLREVRGPLDAQQAAGGQWLSTRSRPPATRQCGCHFWVISCRSVIASSI